MESHGIIHDTNMLKRLHLPSQPIMEDTRTISVHMHQHQMAGRVSNFMNLCFVNNQGEIDASDGEGRTPLWNLTVRSRVFYGTRIRSKLQRFSTATSAAATFVQFSTLSFPTTQTCGEQLSLIIPAMKIYVCNSVFLKAILDMCVTSQLLS